MRLHTGKVISNSLAVTYALMVKELRAEGPKGALAMGEAVVMAHDPRHRPMQRELDLLKKHGILQKDGTMHSEMRKFILACTVRRGSDFKFVDPQTGK